MSDAFWQTKSLFEMTHEQWESLCDGCAKCCLTQLQDEETEQLVFTNVACDYLDENSCQCQDYKNRSTNMPSCMTMTVDNVEQCAEFAPPTCAYRLMLEDKPLPDWHHLISGNRNSVHEAKQSVKGKICFVSDVDDENLENYVVEWPQNVE